MPNEDLIFKAVGRASLVAGPLFLMLIVLLQYQISAPATVPIEPGDFAWLVAGAVSLIILSSLVGAMLAYPTCLIMGGLLLFVANRLPLARPTVLWIAIGGGVALAISRMLFNSTGDVGELAFTGTAMACAALVRSRFRWE